MAKKAFPSKAKQRPIKLGRDRKFLPKVKHLYACSTDIISSVVKLAKEESDRMVRLRVKIKYIVTTQIELPNKLISYVMITN